MDKNITISTQEYQDRVAKLQIEIKRLNLDALFVYSDEYRCGNTLYITGYKPINVIEESPQSVFLQRSGEPIVFLGNINMYAAKKVSWVKEIYPTTDIEKILSPLMSKIKRIGVAGENLLPLTIYNRVKKAFPEAEYVSCPTVVNEKRQVKSETELQLINIACQLGDSGLRKGIEVLKPGMTEIQVCAATEYETRIQGGELGCAYIVSAGQHMELPTWRPGAKIIERGEMVMLDIAPSYKYHCTDVAVTVPVGPPSQEQARVFQSARDVVFETVARTTPGMPAKQMFVEMGTRLEKLGYADYFLPYAKGMRAIGHSVGLDVVEFPNLGPDSEFILEPNMVLGLKLDLHKLPFGGGLRYEVVVQITKDKTCFLNKILEDDLFINAIRNGV